MTAPRTLCSPAAEGKPQAHAWERPGAGLRDVQACGQFAGNLKVVHRHRVAAKVVVCDSRFATPGHAQGLSSAKPLKTQAKMRFSTEGVALYY
jgi:hypothetical protein